MMQLKWVGMKKNKGLFYGFAPNGDICDNDKYFWVQAESFAAAALLAKRNRQKITNIGIGMKEFGGLAGST